jgi:Galactose oxidase, central domain
MMRLVGSEVSVVLLASCLSLVACGDGDSSPPDASQDTSTKEARSDVVDELPGADCTVGPSTTTVSGVWAQATSESDASLPAPRAYAGLSWGRSGGVAASVLLGGGNVNAGTLADAWMFPSATSEWTEFDGGPSARGGLSLTYAGDTLADAGTDWPFVVFGGQGVAYLGDTWMFTGGAWSPFCSASDAGPCGCGPCPRAYHSAAYDAARQQVVLFGGRDPTGTLGDTWALAPEAAWSQRCTSPCEAGAGGCCGAPSARSEHAMAYDVARQVVVLFGGKENDGTLLGDTWEWDGASWQARSSTHAPSARSGHVMAAWPGGSGVLLFGGNDATGPAASQTWVWDGVDWTPIVVAGPSPSPRAFSAMTTDQSRSEVVLFGGGSAGDLGDTWILTLARTTVDGGSCGVEAGTGFDATVADADADAESDDAGDSAGADFCGLLLSCCNSISDPTEQSLCEEAGNGGDESLCQSTLSELEASGLCP